MSRTLHDLSTEERKAYEVWQSKLRDRTLSALEHEHCRRECDALLWKGPNAQVLELTDRVNALETRLAYLEMLIVPKNQTEPSAERRGRPKGSKNKPKDPEAVLSAIPEGTPDTTEDVPFWAEG